MAEVPGSGPALHAVDVLQVREFGADTHLLEVYEKRELLGKGGFGSVYAAHLLEVYETKELLGKGGFGSVYAGVRKADGLPVAIKYISKRKAREKLEIPGHGFLPTEVALMSIVNTEPYCLNILRILEWYEEPSCYYIVLERPEPCENLHQFCNRYGSCLPETVAGLVMVQLIDALKHCKRRGILHRDVKPENIMVQTDTLNVKLIDFGCEALIKDTYKEFTGRTNSVRVDVNRQRIPSLLMVNFLHSRNRHFVLRLDYSTQIAEFRFQLTLTWLKFDGMLPKTLQYFSDILDMVLKSLTKHQDVIMVADINRQNPFIRTVFIMTVICSLDVTYPNRDRFNNDTYLRACVPQCLKLLAVQAANLWDCSVDLVTPCPVEVTPLHLKNSLLQAQCHGFYILLRSAHYCHI
ncbi:serine/threonine-protein kinase pim-3-like isoform X2 [Silurus meridionalis]|nr:serine/threonine-protein kinase pim-3-like isoform X2 [Silurus meridionalis]